MTNGTPPTPATPDEDPESPSDDQPDPRLGKHIDEELERFYRLCPEGQTPVLTILRVHLLTEYYIERLLVMSLPRGDRMVGDAGLSYAQKLTVLEALDILDDTTTQCLRGLNRIRNSCAHEMDREITLADVERIGRPLGSEFTVLRREHYPDLGSLLREVLDALVRDITYHIWSLERERRSPPTKLHNAMTNAPPCTAV